MTNGEGPLKIIWRPVRTTRPLTSRWVLLTVAWTVLLIAAIAMVNLPRHSNTSSTAKQPSTNPGLPAPDRSERGAEVAATRYAVALGSEAMLNPSARHQLLQDVVVPADLNKLEKAFDADYTSAFNAKLGLNADGSAPAGRTFVSRAMPAGVTVTAYSPTQARVAVWCSGLLGLTGANSPVPIATNWFTMTETLQWTPSGWRFSAFNQQDGPQPAQAPDFGQAPPL